MALDPNRFTHKTTEALSAASQDALAGAASSVSPERLLRALLDQAEGTVPAVLAKLSIPIPSLRTKLDARIASEPKAYGATTNAPQLAPGAYAILEPAQRRVDWPGAEGRVVGLPG